MSRVYVDKSVDLLILYQYVTDELRAFIEDTGAEIIEDPAGNIVGIREAYELHAEGFDVMIGNIAPYVKAGGYLYVDYDEEGRGRWHFHHQTKDNVTTTIATFEYVWDFYGTSDDADRAKRLLLEHGWNENRMPEV